MREFRDRDYLRTPEGFFFCVLGSVHPDDRVISYLKYIPDPSGRWGSENRRMRRILPNYTMRDLMRTFKFLRENHPEYLFYSPVMGIEMSAVPTSRIQMHYRPEEKLLRLARAERLDELQRKTVELAHLISDMSKVPIGSFGVTGSILIDIHREFSDIDLVVYGRRNSISVREALKQAYENSDLPIRRFNRKESHEWCLSKAEMYPLTYREAAEILRRRWNRGVYKGTLFSIHPVRLENEVKEKYGDRIFKPKGLIKIEATVSDDSEAEFLPSTYRVEDVKVMVGPKIKDIFEVTTYEGLYGGLAEKDERILAYGKLEEVHDLKRGEKYHRVLIGSREAEGRDYIKPLTG